MSDGLFVFDNNFSTVPRFMSTSNRSDKDLSSSLSTQDQPFLNNYPRQQPAINKLQDSNDMYQAMQYHQQQQQQQQQHTSSALPEHHHHHQMSYQIPPASIPTPPPAYPLQDAIDFTSAGGGNTSNSVSHQPYEYDPTPTTAGSSYYIESPSFVTDSAAAAAVSAGTTNSIAMNPVDDSLWSDSWHTSPSEPDFEPESYQYVQPALHNHNHRGQHHHQLTYSTTATPTPSSHSPIVDYSTTANNRYAGIPGAHHHHSAADSREGSSFSDISRASSGRNANFPPPPLDSSSNLSAAAAAAALAAGSAPPPLGHKLPTTPDDTNSKKRKKRYSDVSVTNSAEKRYKCHICNKYFRRDLPRHMRTHEEQARFSCPFPRSHCTHKRGQFNRPYDFKKHLLHGHFIFDDPRVRGYKDLKSKLQATGCCTCGQRYQADDWINTHIIGYDGQFKCPNLEGENM